jgi:hypothetical protein
LTSRAAMVEGIRFEGIRLKVKKLALQLVHPANP